MSSLRLGVLYFRNMNSRTHLKRGRRISLKLNLSCLGEKLRSTRWLAFQAVIRISRKLIARSMVRLKWTSCLGQSQL